MSLFLTTGAPYEPFGRSVIDPSVVVWIPFQLEFAEDGGILAETEPAPYATVGKPQSELVDSRQHFLFRHDLSERRLW
jgi:hypothetical protein